MGVHGGGENPEMPNGARGEGKYGGQRWDEAVEKGEKGEGS